MLSPVVKRVHRPDLGVQAVERVIMLVDPLHHVEGLLGQQVFQCGLDDVAEGGEVIEQRRPLDVEGLGELRHRDLQPLALEDFHGAASELELLVGFSRAGHWLTECQLTIS